MKAKKTIDVKFVVEKANTLLATLQSSEFKSGVASMVESILHATGNYQGYSYLEFDANEYDKVLAEAREKKDPIWPHERSNEVRVYGSLGRYGRKYHYTPEVFNKK